MTIPSRPERFSLVFFSIRNAKPDHFVIFAEILYKSSAQDQAGDRGVGVPAFPPFSCPLPHSKL